MRALIVPDHSLSQRFTMSGNDTMAPSAKDQIDLRSLVLLAFSATAGVLVEYYDFFIFGYAAASAFPKIFFPDLSPTLALVFSFLIFGAGFPARLLGAFIFGHYGDRVDSDSCPRSASSMNPAISAPADSVRES